GLGPALDRAHRTGDIVPLVAVIAATNTDQATLWHQSINSLWQSYARETAARLIVEAASRTDAPIVQYWVSRVLEVEPEIAEDHFPPEFLAELFRPEVAKSCGPCGCS